MKAKRASALAPEPSTQTQVPEVAQEGEFASLLAKPLASRPGPPTLTLGHIREIDVRGQLWVEIASATSPARRLRALSLCAIGEEHLGAMCALQFIDNNPEQPLILGLIQGQPEVAWAKSAIPARLSLRAEEEIELRCGDTLLRLTADGWVELRGLHIDAQASAALRLRGSSVQVN